MRLIRCPSPKVPNQYPSGVHEAPSSPMAINYSLSLRANPQNEEDPKKAYALAQYTGKMSLEQFAKHIADHGCVYSRADVYAILTLMVDCMKEQLLLGQRIELGDLGTFSVVLSSIGADSMEEFNANVNITRVRPKWTVGKLFKNMVDLAEFEYVGTRDAQAKVKKALKKGDKTVTL